MINYTPLFDRVFAVVTQVSKEHGGGSHTNFFVRDAFERRVKSVMNRMQFSNSDVALRYMIREDKNLRTRLSP